MPTNTNFEDIGKQSSKVLAKAKLGESKRTLMELAKKGVPPGELAYVFKTAAGYYAKKRKPGNYYSNPIWYWTPDIEKARRVTKTHGIDLRLWVFIECPDLYASAELILDPASASGAIAARLGEAATAAQVLVCAMSPKKFVARLLEGGGQPGYDAQLYRLKFSIPMHLGLGRRLRELDDAKPDSSGNQKVDLFSVVARDTDDEFTTWTYHITTALEPKKLEHKLNWLTRHSRQRAGSVEISLAAE